MHTYSALGTVENVCLRVTFRCRLVSHSIGVRHTRRPALQAGVDTLPEGQAPRGGDRQEDQAIVLGDRKGKRHGGGLRKKEYLGQAVAAGWWWEKASWAGGVWGRQPGKETRKAATDTRKNKPRAEFAHGHVALRGRSAHIRRWRRERRHVSGAPSPALKRSLYARARRRARRSDPLHHPRLGSPAIPSMSWRSAADGVARHDTPPEVENLSPSICLDLVHFHGACGYRYSTPPRLRLRPAECVCRFQY